MIIIINNNNNNPLPRSGAKGSWDQRSAAVAAFLTPSASGDVKTWLE